jgi:hypothetical protein
MACVDLVQQPTETAMNEATRPAAKTPTDDTLVGLPDHPIAAAAGAVLAGAATGAVVGTAAGPIGAVIGAAVGAVAGGLGGDAIASSLEQAHDADYWRENYTRRPYFQAGDSFDDFGPAYEYGTSWRERHAGRSFDDVEPELATQWERARGSSRLGWDRARHAARDAWGDPMPRG